MTSAAIYARVSSARQKKDETIGSQTAALREHAAQARLEVPAEWIFQDEGHSGATLVRPALEALRDLVAQGCVDVVLVYSPDRLARKFAYQALLLEEFARAGVRVEFVKGPRAGANLRQEASSSRHPANSCPTSAPAGGTRSCGLADTRGRFISSSGHSITRPVKLCSSILCRSSRNWKYTAITAARPARVDGLASRSTLPK